MANAYPELVCNRSVKHYMKLLALIFPAKMVPLGCQKVCVMSSGTCNMNAKYFLGKAFNIERASQNVKSIMRN